MDKFTAKSLAKKIQISKDYIVREEYEMLLLKEIYESGLGSSLMFKGGTALRLAYNSPRFSEDLDFNLINRIDKTKFIEFVNGVGKKYPDIVNVEAHEEHNTIFALVKIKIDFLDKAFSIKIEISKRANHWVKGKDYRDKVIKSEVVPLTAFAQVATLEVILKDKVVMLKNRKAARDIFDHWFINQLLKKDVNVDFSHYDKTQVISELHKQLAMPYRRLVDSWLE